MEQKRIMRSQSERMIAGVCGGLAEYFSVDPTLVRLIFVLAVLLNGIGLVLYMILWLVTPEKSATEAAPAATITPPAEEAASETEQELSVEVVVEQEDTEATADDEE